jgi:hypothetical protein
VLTAGALDEPARAAWLIERRERLVAQLSRRFPRAASLGRDVHELIVDESIEFAALGHSNEVATVDELAALFWSACDVRVRRAGEGRYDTVRAGWRRADEALLERLESGARDDPLVATLEREERTILADVLRALTARERDVIAVKHMGPGNQVLGYKKVARHLALPIGEVRAAERSIREKFERYATAARAREAALERKLGQLLPVPPAAEQTQGRLGAWRDVLADWLGRPFGTDATTIATQLAASGAGRGAGGVLAIKLATLCIGGGGVIGAACLATGVLPAPRDRDIRAQPPATTQKHAAEPTPTRSARERPLTRIRATATVTATATPPPRRARARPAATQGGTGPQDHEQAPASPAPADAASDGSSEFDPLYQPSQPVAPAPVPAAPGGGEFF